MRGVGPVRSLASALKPKPRKLFVRRDGSFDAVGRLLLTAGTN